MAYSEWLPDILQHLAGGGLGLASASLATHWGMRSAERLPGESRRPQCVFCLRTLEWYETFPLVSWLFRKDALSLPCPCGKRKNLWHQPAAEAAGFLLGLIAVALAGWDDGIVALCLGLGLLPAIALIDLLFGLIPDELNIGLGLFGFLWQATGQGDAFMALIFAAGLVGTGLLLAIVYSKWRGREMLGIGDVKFFGAAGLWLNLMTLPWFMIAAGFLGAIMGLLWKRAGGGEEFPFGPALCVSLAGCVFYDLALPLFY